MYYIKKNYFNIFFLKKKPYVIFSNTLFGFPGVFFVCELWREGSSFNIFYKIQPADYKSETYVGATSIFTKITLVNCNIILMFILTPPKE
jgi:hypothetical protein